MQNKLLKLTQYKKNNNPGWNYKPFNNRVIQQIKETWNYRHLFSFLGFFTAGQIYRQAILGVGWLIIQPLVLSLSAVLVFGEMLKVSTGAIPMPIFAIFSMAFWFLFRRSIQWMTKNLAMWRGIINRFYIPPLLLLLSTIFPVMLEFCVMQCVAFIAVAYYFISTGTFTIVISFKLFAIVPALMLVIALSLGICCFTTVFNTMARDTWLTMRYIINVWMITTPVLYPIHAIPEKYHIFLYLNPLTPIIELYRWALFPEGQILWKYLILACGEIIVFLVMGLLFFSWKQKKILSYY